jgi:hypothetical protein
LDRGEGFTACMEKNRNTYRILAERLEEIVILEKRDAV